MHIRIYSNTIKMLFQYNFLFKERGTLGVYASGDRSDCYWVPLCSCECFHDVTKKEVSVPTHIYNTLYFVVSVMCKTIAQSYIYNIPHCIKWSYWGCLVRCICFYKTDFSVYKIPHPPNIIILWVFLRHFVNSWELLCV